MKNIKKENLITASVFVIIIFFFAITFWTQKDVAFSEQENRVLQTLPEFTLEKFISGQYSKEINVYFADQFPFRDSFVGAKGIVETLLLKRENNSVVLGKNDNVAVRDMYPIEGGTVDFYNEEKMTAIGKILDQFFEELTKNGIDSALLIPPRTLDVMKSSLPSLFPSYRTESAYELLENELGDSTYVKLLDMYRKMYDNGEYVYYNTDHHWTTLGAYYAYVEIMKSFGMDYYELSDFDIETASDSFFGTTWSRSGFKFVGCDTIEYFHLKDADESKYTSTIHDTTYTKGEMKGFYDRDYLKMKDKYSSFLSGSNKYTSIIKEGEERETLLLIKDSFGHSIAPFLALHFNVEMIDLNYNNNIASYFKTLDVDKVVLVYNMENVISTDNIGKLRFKITTEQ